MDFSKNVLAAAMGLAVSAGAASAVTITDTYEFGNTGFNCNSFDVGVNTCVAAPNEGDNYSPQLATPVDPHLPTLGVFGDIVGVNNPNLVNQYDLPGLGIGRQPGPANANIGDEEDLILFFDHEVTILEFEVASARTGTQRGGFRVAGQPGEEFVMTQNFYATGPQSFVPSPANATGTEFRWSMEDVTPFSNGWGYALHSVTVQFEKKDEPEIIPVPPAAPLLGGALALLAWRARRGKRA